MKERVRQDACASESLFTVFVYTKIQNVIQSSSKMQDKEQTEIAGNIQDSKRKPRNKNQIKNQNNNNTQCT